MQPETERWGTSQHKVDAGSHQSRTVSAVGTRAACPAPLTKWCGERCHTVPAGHSRCSCGGVSYAPTSPLVYSSAPVSPHGLQAAVGVRPADRTPDPQACLSPSRFGTLSPQPCFHLDCFGLKSPERKPRVQANTAFWPGTQICQCCYSDQSRSETGKA